MLINTEEALDKVLFMLKDAKMIAFDWETLPSEKYSNVDKEEASIHHKMCEIEGLSLRSETVEPVYIPFIGTEIPRLYLIDGLKKMFQQDSLFIAHNMQFDAKIADYFIGARPKNKFCTLIGYWYYDENQAKDKVTLGRKIFGMKTIPYKEAKNLGPEEFLEYTLRDAEFTYQLYFWLKEHLDEKHFNLASTIEMEFLDVLIDMTLYGTPCDLEYLKQGEEILTNKALELEAQIYNELGEFNLGSPQQLCEKVYGIKVKRTKKEGLVLTKVDDFSPKKYAKVVVWNKDKNDSTKRTTPSTNYEALSKLDTPTARLIQEYRGITKVLSTYAIGYQRYVIDGRIYPTFNNSGKDSYQYGTVTGRLNSAAPNMQNIPHEPIVGWWLREAIFAPKGRKLVVADEAQLEVRLLAHFSKDPNLIAAIFSGEDIHLATAKILFDKEEISDEERRFAKTQNFATAYGQGIKAMAETLFKSDTKEAMMEAMHLKNRYFERFSTLGAWVESTGNKMASPKNVDHHVKTLIGRKRRLGDDLPTIMYGDDKETIKKKQGQIARCKRQAVNSIIQGSASDVLKIAMVLISKEFKEKNLDAHILLQIHDELVVECAEEIIEEVAEIVKKYMEHPFNEDLRVPLSVEPKICDRWSEGKG